MTSQICLIFGNHFTTAVVCDVLPCSTVHVHRILTERTVFQGGVSVLQASYTASQVQVPLSGPN